MRTLFIALLLGAPLLSASPVLAGGGSSSESNVVQPGGQLEAATPMAVPLPVAGAPVGDCADLGALKNLKGIDPAYYLRARKARPMVTREIRHLDLDAQVLITAWHCDLAALIARPRGDYPDQMIDRVPELQVAELLALQEGILTGLAKTAHPGAVEIIVDELGSSDDRRKQLAAVLLGETRSPVARLHLQSLVESEGVRGALRTAALVGLSKLRSQPALDLLRAEALRIDRNAEERLSAIRSLGNVGNEGAHRAHPRPNSEAIRQGATDALLEVLPTVVNDARLTRAVGEALAVVAHPSAPTRLQTLAGPSSSTEVREASQQALRLVSLARSRL